MKIKSITIGDDLKFVFSKVNNRGFEESYQLKSDEAPRPEFLVAYEQVRLVLIDLFKVFKFGKVDAVITTGIHFKWSKEIGNCVTAIQITGKIKGDECEARFRTDWIHATTDMMEQIAPMLDEAEQYIEGNRAQLQLFYENTEEKEDDLESDADMTFHVNDIAARGAVQ